MVATYWPSTCVFNELYLEKNLALLRHTFPITTFSRVDIYWLVLPWDHDQSTVSVLVGYGRGRVCNLGRTLTKYFRKRQIGITALWMHHGDVIKWKLFFSVTGLLWGNTSVSGGFPSRRPVTPSFIVLFDLCHKQTTEQTVETPVVWDTIALMMTSLYWSQKNKYVSMV